MRKSRRIPTIAGTSAARQFRSDHWRRIAVVMSPPDLADIPAVEAGARNCARTARSGYDNLTP
jgi:hypothetical protein